MEALGADHLPFSSTTLPRMHDCRWVAHSRKAQRKGPGGIIARREILGLEETRQFPLSLGTERNAVEQFSWEASVGWEI